jgi:hypothetical protein
MTTNDPKPWVSTTGFRTAEQAWHPVHGLSRYRPRPEYATPEPDVPEVDHG